MHYGRQAEKREMQKSHKRTFRGLKESLIVKRKSTKEKCFIFDTQKPCQGISGYSNATLTRLHRGK